MSACQEYSFFVEAQVCIYNRAFICTKLASDQACDVTICCRKLSSCCVQELMNRHGKKERLTSVPILCRITLQNAPYKDYNLLVLTSFEVTTVTRWFPRARLL